jgi:hypothetical protein
MYGIIIPYRENAGNCDISVDGQGGDPYIAPSNKENFP